MILQGNLNDTIDRKYHNRLRKISFTIEKRFWCLQKSVQTGKLYQSSENEEKHEIKMQENNLLDH